MPEKRTPSRRPAEPRDERNARTQVPKGVCQELDLICWTTAGGVTLHALTSARSVDQGDIPADQLLDQVAVLPLPASSWSEENFLNQVATEVAVFCDRVLNQVRRVRALAP